MNYTSVEQLHQIYRQHPVVYIDTRKKIEGAIFVAVGQKNEKGVHRGNDFAEKALESGQAAYVIINDPQLKQKHKEDKRFLLVEDGEKALQDLAFAHRQTLTAPIIAIAGSNGKTTTKELLHRVLATQYKTFSTVGNLNNHLGVPLSLLSIDASYEMIILEIGANHLHETKFLAEIVIPDYGLVTNCGKDHLGEYGSVANIIKANKELYDVLAANNKKAFVCQNDALLVEMVKEVKDVVFYGKGTTVNAEITASPFLAFELWTEKKSIEIQSNLFGKFWLDTLLNAAAIGYHFGIDILAIKKALESYLPAALRSELIEWNGNKVLLDCYNANPSSMEAFLNEIQYGNLKESKILVLGEMLELGDYSQEEHQTLVDSIIYADFEKVYLVGDEFLKINLPQKKNLMHLQTTRAAKTYIQEKAYQQKYIFVKGSRGNKLETIFE